MLSRVWLCDQQAPLSMEIPRQEYWSGLPCPLLGGSSQPGDSTQVSCTAGRFFTTGLPPNHWTATESPVSAINILIRMILGVWKSDLIRGSMYLSQ